MSYNSTMNINKDIEKYWRELFAEQMELCIYSTPPTDSKEEQWFLEGAKYMLMLLRYTRTEDFNHNSL